MLADWLVRWLVGLVGRILNICHLSNTLASKYAVGNFCVCVLYQKGSEISFSHNVR